MLLSGSGIRKGTAMTGDALGDLMSGRSRRNGTRTGGRVGILDMNTWCEKVEGVVLIERELRQWVGGHRIHGKEGFWTT
jgi:hypothetical protein